MIRDVLSTCPQSVFHAASPLLYPRTCSFLSPKYQAQPSFLSLFSLTMRLDSFQMHFPSGNPHRSSTTTLIGPTLPCPLTSRNNNTLQRCPVPQGALFDFSVLALTSSSAWKTSVFFPSPSSGLLLRLHFPLKVFLVHFLIPVLAHGHFCVTKCILSHFNHSFCIWGYLLNSNLQLSSG